MGHYLAAREVEVVGKLHDKRRGLQMPKCCVRQELNFAVGATLVVALGCSRWVATLVLEGRATPTMATNLSDQALRQQTTPHIYATYPTSIASSYRKALQA